MCCCRIVLFLFVFINLILRVSIHETSNTKFFMIYLTNWGMVVLVAHQLCDLILVVYEYVKKRNFPGLVRE